MLELNKKSDISDIINRLKSLKRFDIDTYKGDSEYSIQKEHSYKSNGDYID